GRKCGRAQGVPRKGNRPDHGNDPSARLRRSREGQVRPAQGGTRGHEEAARPGRRFDRAGDGNQGGADEARGREAGGGEASRLPRFQGKGSRRSRGRGGERSSGCRGAGERRRTGPQRGPREGTDDREAGTKGRGGPRETRGPGEEDGPGGRGGRRRSGTSRSGRPKPRNFENVNQN